MKEEEKQGNVEELDILQKFWGNEENLDETDKFLRKYILTKGWVDRDDYNNINQTVDKEDEERDIEIEDFEEKYNFRYEEEGGTDITSTYNFLSS